MARVLVTGASGLLGANLVWAAAGEHAVSAISRTHPLRLYGVTSGQADLTVRAEALRAIEAAAPEWVIHCAAATDVDACEAQPEWAFRLNRDMARWVAEAARKVGARLVHISTDAVFDGEHGGYREDDPPGPVNVYGRSKLAGEQAVAEAHPQAVIVRTNIYGWNALPKHSLAEWFLARLEAGRACPGFEDVWVSPILVNDLAPLLLRLAGNGVTGLVHVPGDDCVSKYAFGQAVARQFGLDPAQIHPVSVDQAGLLAPRPRRLCLDGSRARQALGMRLPGLSEGLGRFAALKGQGHPSRLRAMLPLEAARAVPAGEGG